MALHDEAAVLPMSAEPDRARLLGDVAARVDRVAGEFDALASEPALGDASLEIGEVQRSLASLRGALQAQIDAQAIDPDLLRERLGDLEGALQRFRERISPPTT
jgi:hypothetical protein